MDKPAFKGHLDVKMWLLSPCCASVIGCRIKATFRHFGMTKFTITSHAHHLCHAHLLSIILS